MTIHEVIEREWSCPHLTDRIVGLLQVSNYVLILTVQGRVWKAEIDFHGSFQVFLAGHFDA